MAFSTLSSTLIQVAKAIKREIFTTLKDNQDDIQGRLVTVEAASNKIEPFNSTVYNASAASTFTGLRYWEAPVAFTLLDAKVGIFVKGALTGTLEFDVLKSPDRDRTNGTSIFTTRPSILFSGASDYDDSTNALIAGAQQSVAQGDILILDITSIPSPKIGIFRVLVTGELN